VRVKSIEWNKEKVAGKGGGGEGGADLDVLCFFFLLIWRSCLWTSIPMQLLCECENNNNVHFMLNLNLEERKKRRKKPHLTRPIQV